MHTQKRMIFLMTQKNEIDYHTYIGIATQSIKNATVQFSLLPFQNTFQVFYI